MQPATTPRKKLRSPGQEAPPNPKTSITCSNVPESLFDPNAATKHFSKFGRVQRIRLFPKRLACIVEFDVPSAVERAVLNAGAYDGFMFDVTRTKPRVRKRSKRDDDPDWVPDSDVAEELSAMGGAPSYRLSRQKPMEIGLEEKITRVIKATPPKKKTLVPVARKPPKSTQPTSGIESPVVVTTTQTTMSTFEAAAELHQLRYKMSLSPDEQWRILDARDRILRAWGGAGARVKVGGATIGTCQDMCPEKELLHRQAEHQVMTLETVLDSDGQLEPWRAVKQYSRSSADQEIPMCYELRPADVLMKTCSYLLQEIADTTRPVFLADWFHFMWDRLRSIRKDITQQALCCSESIRLVEMCARFHAHCAARLADLEHTQFDQKLNTDNLTKCLQTLKHMYADVTPEHKPNEAEFRGYIALLNLGDANFWWEIKQLPENIQKSEPIIFAIHVFNALDNNNYVRFFRLIQQRATYLQACILLRYFNDVRARALARIVKAYAPRGGSKFPAMDIMNQLAFESVENMKSFINHYGLRFSRADEYELSIKLDRNQFIEDSDPYPIARSINLIESKRQRSVGQMIAGGPIPKLDYSTHSMHTSFSRDGRLTEQALVAEDQGFDTANDSNKDIKALKAEIQRLAQGGKVYSNSGEGETKANLFVKPDIKTLSPKPKSIQQNIVPVPDTIESKQFFFKPAITVAPTEVIKNSPEKLFADKNTFSFSKPQETVSANVFIKKDTPFASTRKNIFVSKSNTDDAKNIFEAPDTNVDLFKNAQNVFKSTKPSENLFKKPEMPQSIFGQVETKQSDPKPQFGIKSTPNIFAAAKEGSLFTKTDSTPKFDKGNNIFAKPAPVEEIKGSLFTKTEIAPKFDRGNNIFANPIAADETKTSLFTKTDSAPKFDKSNNIFAKPSSSEEPKPSNIFGAFSKPAESTNIFAQPETQKKSIFSTNGDITGNTSPGSLFKTACNPPNGSDSKGYSIFQSKNKAQTVADNILNSVNATNHNNVYDYDKNDEEILQRELDEKIREEQRLLQENIRKEEEQRQEQLRLEEERRKEEARRKQEEQRMEERRKQEEKIQEEKRQQELKKRLEEEKKAELKRKAEEKERKFKEAVDRESTQLVEDLVTEVVNETNKELLKSEQEDLMQIVKLANNITDEITRELSDEISHIEMKAELFLTRKIMKKWFYIWQKQFYRNLNRRKMLDDTPVWIPDRTPVEEALYLRRRVENAALKNMNAIHKGYKFSGEPNQLPPPEPYNIMDIIRSPLLKRMKQINYPYDRCFFWKVTMISPGENKWLYKKINVQNWIIDAFSDKKKHESDTLIHVSKQSWNHLMDFAISVSLVNEDTMSDCLEAIEGTNGVLFYSTDYDTTLIKTIEQTLKLKYPYQNIPVAIITPKLDDAIQIQLQELLSEYVSQKIISGYKIFALDSQDVNLLLNNATKTALKWLAKKYPPIPPIEIDYLKSICQRYLGNEIWCRFRTERNHCMYDVIKDINKLIECYNVGVDKLTEVITNEDLFNYSSFPLEFKSFLDSSSPYPKPYEFIPSNVRNSENISTIKDYMKLLKLPTASAFNPKSVAGMQQQIRTYCNQIGWFEDPEEVVCKVVAVIPNELSDINMPHEDFTKYFAQYNLIDFLNIIIYEKINRLNNFNNRFAIYDKAVLREHCNFNWLYELRVITDMKHRALEYEDELDYYIEAKRRKVELDSLEYLMLEDKDSTIVEENIKSTEINISKYSNCSEAVKQLEIELEEKVKQSEQFENMLRAALADV